MRSIRAREQNPLTPPAGHVPSILLGLGLLATGAVIGKVAGSARTGINAAIAGGLVTGVLAPGWREVAFSTSAFGAAAIFLHDLAE